MSTYHLGWPGTAAPSLLAALTTWVALWSWAGFAERASGFLVPALGGCLLVAATGMLLRSARAVAPLVLLGQVAVVLLWFTHRWAADAALGGWLPTPASVEQIGRVLAAGVRAAQIHAAPVPDTAPQIHPLLVVAAVATALIVDLVACGLRRVPVAGLPLLAVYTAPVSILPAGVPWWAFAAGAFGFLSLLADDQGRRLGGWGRPVGQSAFSDSLGTRVSTASVRASARRIGLTATGLAVVVPMLVPTLSSGLFAGAGPGGGGGGDVRIENPMVDLRRDLARGRDVDLLRVRTAGDPSYLRISVLDSFDGQTWKPSRREIPSDQRADGLLPSPPGLGSSIPTTEEDWSIETVSSFASQWLPVPYPAATVDVDGDWRYDVRTLDFLSADGEVDAGDLDYRVSHLRLGVSREVLSATGAAPEDIFTENTALPSDLPDLVPRLAREVTAGAASRFERAVRLQQWFRTDGGFDYSLRRVTPGNGTDDLLRFLDDGPGGRVGYCEQFAAAMAVMGRSIGIPARVAIGFLRPQQVGEDVYVYSAHDMHAWPELYFHGVGWVRFEPTPQDRTGIAPAYTTGRVGPAGPTTAPSGAASSRAPNDFDRPTRTAEPGAAAGGGRSGGVGPGLFAGFVGGVLLVLVVVAPRGLRSWVRGRRWAVATTGERVAEAAWSELRDTALDLRLAWDDSVTLRTRARSLSSSFGEPGDAEGPARTRRRGPAAAPEATRALERVVQHLERARFAREVEDRAEARADVEACVRALYDGASPRLRFRATWVPASLTRSLRPHERRRMSPAPLPEPGLDRAV